MRFERLRLIREVDGEGNAVDYRYDALDRRIRVVNGRGAAAATGDEGPELILVGGTANDEERLTAPTTDRNENDRTFALPPEEPIEIFGLLDIPERFDEVSQDDPLVVEKNNVDSLIGSAEDLLLLTRQ